MEQIKDILPRAIEAFKPSTQERAISTKALADLADFKTFNDPTLQRMRNETARMLTAFRNNLRPYWLSLLGASGSGKTFLARLAFGEIHPWYDVIGWARDGDQKGRDKFLNLALDRRFDRYEGKYIYKEQLVVLDDIGAEYSTDFSRSKLCEFLDRRESRWTMITSNMSLEQIGNTLDPRIASRMIRNDSVVVEAEVPDFNLRPDR